MYEKSSRATNMIYTQMLFALAMDKLVFGHSPELLSIIGSSLILGAAICIAMKRAGVQTTGGPEPPQATTSDEECGLVAGIDAGDEDELFVDELEAIPMREVAPKHIADRY
jgi:hypothetical protein